MIKTFSDAVPILAAHGTPPEAAGSKLWKVGAQTLDKGGVIALARQIEGGLASTSGVLSAALQDLARRYVAAQQRSGEALLEACAALAEARQLAKHGEWGMFLAATRTSEGTAKRLLDIHAEAERNPQYRQAVASNWIGATVAAEIAQPSFPAEARQALLSAEEPPTKADVQAAKSATVADLGTPDDLRKAGVQLVRHGAWWQPVGFSGEMNGWTGKAEPWDLAVHAAREEIARRAKPNISEVAPATPDRPSDFADVLARLARHGVTLHTEMQGNTLMFVMHTEGKAVGIATPTWSNVTSRLEYLERAAAPAPAVDQPPPPDLSAYGYTARHLPDGRIAIHCEGNLETEHTHAQLNDLLQFWRSYPPIPADLAAAGTSWCYRSDRMYQVQYGDTPHHTGYTADECLANARDFLERTGRLSAPAPEAAETDDSAIVATIRAKAAALGLELIWEDDQVLLYWPDERDDIEQMDLMSYGVALEWLDGDALNLAALRKEQQLMSPADAYAAVEETDTILIAKAEQAIAAGDTESARDLLNQVQVATYRRDQVLQTIAASAARAFLDDQRQRLKNFSEHAMVSQATYRQALDHIAALLRHCDAQ